jgi:hypothetical protein
MPVKWSEYWASGDNNDVNPAFKKEDILSIIQSVSPSILRVQPAAVREAVQLVQSDSSDVTIIKGLHHVGTEKIDIKKTGYPAGPVVHLYCMNYSLVDSGLRVPYDDLVRVGTGWRITGSSVYDGDGHAELQGMDKDGEIDKKRGTGMGKLAAQDAFKEDQYNSSGIRRLPG